MQKIDLFGLEKHNGPYQNWPRQTRLFFNGADTGQMIHGYVIEAQYRFSKGYILITSLDSFFEQSNDIFLLNKKFKILTKMELCLPSASCLLCSHQSISEREIRLQYSDRLIFTLSILKKNFFLWKRYSLKVENLSLPEPDLESTKSITEIEIPAKSHGSSHSTLDNPDV